MWMLMTSLILATLNTQQVEQGTRSAATTEEVLIRHPAASCDGGGGGREGLHSTHTYAQNHQTPSEASRLFC
eukprot:c26291_g1_i1 orf=70-285(+)